MNDQIYIIIGKAVTYMGTAIAILGIGYLLLETWWKVVRSVKGAAYFAKLINKERKNKPISEDK